MVTEPVSADTGKPPETTRQYPTLAFVVRKSVERLQSDYLSENEARCPRAKAILAELRHGISTKSGRYLFAWQSAFEQLFADRFDQIFGEEKTIKEKSFHDITASEKAAYEALSLFACHMQSRKKPMHAQNQTIARAAGILMARRESASLKVRFNQILSSRTDEIRLTHLHGLISLLRSEEIPCDYGQLAADLAALRDPRKKERILLTWARDFSYGLNSHLHDSQETSTTEN
ncbi:type I-E CRISPR-associated protein Cse2/CasB [Schaalia sp. lx-100]|uniref:type I-E CRISPR-associated protein Cse2/CasB n=1 Tax=Schaalia sp. lx-100 TaxID=2899081 RepID=UPI001E3E5B86|nr:type I-E CRISPR-associated protein Cse2/CasB [Schaalia sp. lx-100]MCD4556948.1 type I-E CRISPR-associated protein Cse2/CasB [Schaalia sp. lx-100]